MDSVEIDLLSKEYRYNKSELYVDTFNRINNLTKDTLNATWSTVLSLLSDWQKGELANVDSELGIRCLLDQWFNTQNVDLDVSDGKYCTAAWDGVYCWPTTHIGENITIPCSEDLSSQDAKYMEGYVTGTCLENGTWLGGLQTKYDLCTVSSKNRAHNKAMPGHLSNFVRHMVFVGSILSIFCLVMALTIIIIYKNLHTRRFTVNIHLMLALLLRFILLYIIAEPFVFQRETTYRDYGTLCKSVILVYLYSTLASIMWMLVQGIYLNSKLTTNVLTGESKRKLGFYYILGWAFPGVITAVYLAAMIINEHEETCWKGYADMTEIWIILTPITAALLLNGIFLVKILRVVTQKTQCPNGSLDRKSLISVAKAPVVLFPILGINNLLLVHNPGGVFDKYFISLNTFFGSTQGIFVSIVYCFMCKEVRQTLRRSYHRFQVRRSVKLTTRQSQRKHIEMNSISQFATRLDETTVEHHVV